MSSFSTNPTTAINTKKQNNNLREASKHFRAYLLKSDLAIIYFLTLIFSVSVAILIAYLDKGNPIGSPHLIMIAILYSTVIFITLFFTQNLISQDRIPSKLAMFGVTMLTILSSTAAMLYLETDEDKEINLVCHHFHPMFLVTLMIYFFLLHARMLG